MKGAKIFTYINQHKYFLLFILLFAYIQSICTRIIAWKTLSVYIFTPEAALVTLFNSSILFVIIQYFLKKWQTNKFPKLTILLRVFFTSIIVYSSIVLSTELLIAYIFGNVSRNFTDLGIIISLLSSFLDAIIYGSFFLAYSYYQINQINQEKLIQLNNANASQKINQLKHQLNPHFLFNNLNVLDQLIAEDSEKASDFLNEFAEIYRYVLASTEKQLVNLEDEIDFTRQYFKLIEYKFGKVYQLIIKEKSIEGFVIPLSLQLLIENAIKHNIGSLDNPIKINISIDEKISVSNNIQMKNNKILSSGKGLNNLNTQYLLLTNREVEVIKTEDCFTVNLPIIQEI